VGGSEKTLEDNAALLHVLVDGGVCGFASRITESVRRPSRGGSEARWPTTIRSGFFNAVSARTIDKTMYVDRNALVVGALIRAAALFDDVWLRDLALGAFESVVAPTYKPGDGVGHVAAAGSTGALLGPAGRSDSRRPRLDLGARRNRPASVLDARAEVLQFAVRTMWDERAGRFRDRADADDPLLRSSSTATRRVHSTGSPCSRAIAPIRSARSPFFDRWRARLPSGISMRRPMRWLCGKSSSGIRRGWS
jgi:hypothetical protein